MIMRRIARNSVVRAIARRVLPDAFRGKVAGTLIQPSDADLFHKMLSEHASMSAVPGRVLMVCGSLQPGGAERQVVNTLIGLADSPVESVTLLCDYLEGGTPEKRDFYLPLALESGAPVRTIKTHGQRRNEEGLPQAFLDIAPQLHPSLVLDITNLYFEFRTMRPEVVHAWLDWSNVRVGLAAMLAGVPKVVLSGRNLSPRHFDLNTEYFHPIYKALSEYSGDRVIFLNNSQAGACDYADWLEMPSDRIDVIRNGVQFTDDLRPSSEYNVAFRERLGIPADAPLIGGMFRFSAEKQPLLWIESAAKIAEIMPDAHFILFGQGSMLSVMQRAVKEHGIEMQTHFFGVIAPALNGLSPCDLIMLTSTGEGTPNVLLEAQWLGLPVVTTDAGGAGEAVLDGITGTVVKQNDADVIADATVTILRNEKFREMAREAGPAFISERYGMSRMIRETLSVYKLEGGANFEIPSSQAVESEVQ